MSETKIGEAIVGATTVGATTADKKTIAGPANGKAAVNTVTVAAGAPEDIPTAEKRAAEETSCAERRARVRSPIPSLKTVRRALGLTQEAFAVRYGIPLGTLRDWEQGRTEPDQPARAYIRIIASNPEWVSQALASAP